MSPMDARCLQRELMRGVRGGPRHRRGVGSIASAPDCRNDSPSLRRRATDVGKRVRGRGREFRSLSGAARPGSYQRGRTLCAEFRIRRIQTSTFWKRSIERRRALNEESRACGVVGAALRSIATTSPPTPKYRDRTCQLNVLIDRCESGQRCEIRQNTARSKIDRAVMCKQLSNTASSGSRVPPPPDYGIGIQAEERSFARA
jgi:hypothetical protein